MKKLLSLILCGVILLCSCSAQKEEPASESKHMVIPVENTTMMIPDSFETQSSENFNNVYVRDDASMVLTCELVKDIAYTFDAYQDALLTQYEAVTDEVELLSIADYTLEQTSGKGIMMNYSIELPSTTVSLSCFTGFFFYNGYAYLLTCKCKPENFEANKKDFIEAFESIYYK